MQLHRHEHRGDALCGRQGLGTNQHRSKRSPPQSPSPNKFPINMLITGLSCLRKWVSHEVSRPGTEGYPGTAIFPIGVPGGAIMQGSKLFLGLPHVR